MNTILTVILLALIMIAALIYIRRYSPKIMPGAPRPEDYIGKVYTLEFPVINGTGVLLVDGTTWRINCKDLPAGARIKIVKTDGMILLAIPN
jgi:membrane protein implicated in regulation of membrane protease activity